MYDGSSCISPWQWHIACVAVQPMSPVSNEAHLPKSSGRALQVPWLDTGRTLHRPDAI